MLEIEIKSTKVLNTGSQFWDKIKQRNMALADRMSKTNPPIAKRLESCCEFIKFKECKNGFLIFKSAWFCRVRGCPVCEWRKSRQISARVAHAASKVGVEAWNWWHITLHLNPTNIQSIESDIDLAHKGFGRISQLTIWKFKGGFRFTQISFREGSFRVIVHFLGIAPTTFCSGKYHIKQVEWKKLWQKSTRLSSLPKVEIKKLGKPPLNHIAHKAKILSMNGVSLELCPNADLAMLVEVAHRKTLIAASGIFRRTFQEDRRSKKRKYYPSEKAALDQMTTKVYAHLPNPDDEQHDEQFLFLPEYCWDKEWANNSE